VGGMSPGFAVLALAAILVWIVLLVWLSSWIILRLRLRYGWTLLDWRTIVIPFVALTGAIHLGNFALDWIDEAVGTGRHEAPVGFPSAFLIGSVAIGVGIAVVRALRR
jgi:hypothetical protein